MATITITKLYDLLSDKVGKETADNLISYVDAKIKEEVENNSRTLSTKEDLVKEISRLEIKISESKSELIKWMFIFWIGQLAATFGFILLFLRK